MNKEIEILFLIDISQSMNKCIRGLIDITSDFIEGLSLLQFKTKLSLLGVDRKTFRVLDFTSNTELVISSLQKLSKYTEHGADEFTLPALDFALDLNWGSGRKIIVIFSDECLNTGYSPEFQLSKKNELQEKLIQSGVYILFFGRKCEDYLNFFLNDSHAPGRTNYFDMINENQKDFSKVDFQLLKELLIKSASSIQSLQIKKHSTGNDIYNLKNKVKVIKL